MPCVVWLISREGWNCQKSFNVHIAEDRMIRLLQSASSVEQLYLMPIVRPIAIGAGFLLAEGGNLLASVLSVVPKSSFVRSI